MNKKYIKSFIVLILTFIIGISSVNAAKCDKYTSEKKCGKHTGCVWESNKCQTTDDLEVIELSTICSDKNVKRVVKATGIILFVSKILVPILLIAMGTVGFVKATIAGDEKVIKETAMKSAKNLIAAVVIFVIPTIVNVVLSLAEDSKYSTDDYVNCRVCLFETSKCK